MEEKKVFVLTERGFFRKILSGENIQAKRKRVNTQSALTDTLNGSMFWALLVII